MSNKLSARGQILVYSPLTGSFSGYLMSKYRDAMLALFKQVPPNAVWTLEFGRWYPRRSTGRRSQNNGWHGWLQVGCDVTGNDYADLELYILRRAFRRGYPALKNGNEEIVYSLNDHQPIPLPFKLSNTQQAATALSELEQWAAEEGIKLPRYEEEKVKA